MVGALVSFLGMSIVANIDNIMGKTITHCDIAQEIANNPIHYKRGKKSFGGDIAELKEWMNDPSKGVIVWIPGFLMIVLNRILMIAYICLYFYFGPFLVLLFLEVLKYKHPLIE